MTIGEIISFFQDKGKRPCPLTEKLVKFGYQQRSGGYINKAICEGIEVDYTQNMPSQYWHLMSYCISRDANKRFGKNIVCGELIFWMAEVSRCVSKKDLLILLERIVNSASYNDNGRPIYDRRKWNHMIHNICFDKIFSKIKQQKNYGRYH